MFTRQNYHSDKFLKRNPSTNFREKKKKKKKKQVNEKTKTKDGFACRLLAAFNFDALFAITLSKSPLNFYI